MAAEHRLEPVEAPEVPRQAQLGLDPGQRALLQPVEHLRRHLVQAQQLAPEHRQQHQQQGQQDQPEQAENQDHPPGARQAKALKAIHQRVAQVGQQHPHQERRKYRVKLIEQPTQQEEATQP
ncbi:hypothetical protein D3C85_1580970 [compost metagenome]